MTDLALLTALEGSLPDEFVPAQCRKCGAWFELDPENVTTLCPECAEQTEA